MFKLIPEILFAAILFAYPALAAPPVGVNLLEDPGFERYEFVSQSGGYYVPAPNAAWVEKGNGRGSVRYDENDWTVPPEMARERPLGFTPATTGYQGSALTQSKGLILLEQDITDPDRIPSGLPYEAWIWMGAAGADDDSTNINLKEEEGGWTAFFYDNNNTALWRDNNAMETHVERFDFWGKPGSYVRISGIGVVPPGTRGVRFRIEATTWNAGTVPQDHGTRVAIDNAWFGIPNANLLQNGDFEQDSFPVEFKHWQIPDTWWASPGTFTPIDINGFTDNYDHGNFRPYFGGKYAYGYAQVINNWLLDAYSFGQDVNVTIPPGSELAFSYYWFANVKLDDNFALRRPLVWVDVGFEYRDGTTILRTDEMHIDFPIASNSANNSRFDQNADKAYNPQLRLLPPDGTNQIGVHVRVFLNCFPAAENLFGQSVDDFSLRIAGKSSPGAASSLMVR